MARAPKEECPGEPGRSCPARSQPEKSGGVTATAFCWLRARHRPTRVQREKEEALPLHGGVSRSHRGPGETVRAIFEKATHRTAFARRRLCLDHPLSSLATDSYFLPVTRVSAEAPLRQGARPHGPAPALPGLRLTQRLPQCPALPGHPHLSVCLSPPDCALCEDGDFASCGWLEYVSNKHILEKRDRERERGRGRGKEGQRPASRLPRAQLEKNSAPPLRLC